MDREWLAEQLEAGRSIGQIAREIGKDPSTVSYWMGKFGLRSRHAERHGPRGGIGRDALAALVDEGLSSREIAARLGCSQATVRHWLRRHGLQTRLGARRGSTADRIESTCRKHGRTQFARRPGGYVCLRCRAEAVTRRRQNVKRILVEEAGGACVICGYDRCVAVLHFHHRDPATKRFALASRGLGRSIAELREEAAKCTLLCSNCHMEVEAGIATLPGAPASPPG